MEARTSKGYVCLVAACVLTASGVAGNETGGDVAAQVATAQSLERQGDYPAALEILLAQLKRSEGGRQGELLRAVILNNLGSVYHYLDQDSQAESCYRRSIEAHERLVGAGDQATIRASLNLAVHYIETRQPAKAERLGLMNLAKRQEAIEGNEGDRARLFAVIGAVRKLQGNLHDAERYHQEALAIWNHAAPEGTEVMRALNNLAGIYADSGRNAEALTSYKRALEIGESVLGPEHPGLVTLLANEGAAYFFARGPAEAVPYYERALAIGEKKLGSQHTLVAKVMFQFASVLDQVHRKGEAKELRRQAQAIFSAKASTAPGSQTVEYSSLLESSRKRR